MTEGGQLATALSQALTSPRKPRKHKGERRRLKQESAATLEAITEQTMLEKLEVLKDNIAEVQQPALATPEKEEAIGLLSKSEQIPNPSSSGVQAKAGE